MTSNKRNRGRPTPCAARMMASERSRLSGSRPFSSWKCSSALCALSTMMIAASTMAPMEVVVDSTVQEKNVTYPLDAKQYRKIIIRC